MTSLDDSSNPLAEFMKVVENVKGTSFVHALQIDSFELSPQWSKDDYSDAIVNIFTRLNTAGRTLTREEITLAWLKVGWVSVHTDGKPAGQCLEELNVALADRDFVLGTDEVVRLISFMWSVEHRGGLLLDPKDLLKGEVVRSMAVAVSSAWKRLDEAVKRGADLIKERDLIQNQGSFNAIIVFLTWYRLVLERLDVVSKALLVVKHDDLENKSPRKHLNSWIDGCLLPSGRGSGAKAQYEIFSDLRRIFMTLNECSETLMPTPWSPLWKLASSD